jgi:hypothetical protein
MHDVLYFANNDAPTIFFQLNWEEEETYGQTRND